MNIKLYVLAGTLVSVLFLGAGCADLIPFAPKKTGAGIYKSTDEGKTFTQKNTLKPVTVTDAKGKTKTSKDKKVFNSSVTRFLLYGQEEDVLFAASPSTGLFRSDDQAGSWLNIFAGASLNSFTVDSNSSDIIYISAVSAEKARIYKTENGGKEWKEVYTEPTSGTYIVDVQINSQNADIIYAATNTGVLIKSINGGKEWTLLNELKKNISRLQMLKADNSLYALTQGAIFKSRDGGVSFNQIKLTLQNSSSSGYLGTSSIAFTSFAISENNPNLMYVGGIGELWRSTDYGQTWNKLYILSTTAKEAITAITVNPDNANIIYYTAGSVLYRSPDNGSSWSTTPLGFTGQITNILIKKQDSGIIYLSVY